MSKKIYWGFATLILLIIGAFVFLIVKNQAEIRQLEREAAAVQKQLQQQNAQQVPQGHVHDDGTFHEGEHHNPRQTEPKVQWTAPEGAVLKPNFPKVDPKEDPVKAAYKRLEYIKNNPYAWGGVHSERATQLIAQLLPPPVLLDHAHGEEVSALMDELIAQGDPRSAKVIITTLCEGSMGGKIMTDALVAIGPPAVPFILPYLEKVIVQGGYVSPSVFRILANIAAMHRNDLGGIVEHILIPKFIMIAADEDSSHYDRPLPREAQAALAQLQ